MTINNCQPSIAMHQAIVLFGLFPSNGFDQGDAIPMSAIRNFASIEPDIPSCSGQILPIASFTALFSLIGTLYGGNGTTTFALPNLAGRLSAGISPSLDLGESSGTTTLPIFASSLPANYGGSSTDVTNDQPYLGSRFLIRAVSDPTPNTDPNPDIAFVGSIMQFAAYSSTPLGFLACEGQVLNIVDYPDLFATIGDTFGGDGVTTFALPDLRGRTIVGDSAAIP